MQLKQCNHCTKNRKLSSFSPDKRNKDGLQGICNYCRSEKRKGTHKHNPKNNAYHLQKQLQHIAQVSEVYVIAELKRGTNLTTEDIRKYPNLIETKRKIIINKRAIKNEKRKRAER